MYRNHQWPGSTKHEGAANRFACLKFPFRVSASPFSVVLQRGGLEGEKLHRSPDFFKRLVSVIMPS